VRTRTSLGRRWRAEALAPWRPSPGCCGSAARVSTRRQLDPTVPRPPKKRSTPPPLPEGCAPAGPVARDGHPRGGVHVLARRHPAAGYRKICARARRAAFVVNRKRVARLAARVGLHPHGAQAASQGAGPAVQRDRPQRVVADRHDQLQRGPRRHHSLGRGLQPPPAPRLPRSRHRPHRGTSPGTHHTRSSSPGYPQSRRSLRSQHCTPTPRSSTTTSAGVASPDRSTPATWKRDEVDGSSKED
jgi:hypothetical protein